MVKKYVRFFFYLLYVCMYIFFCILNNFSAASPTCIVSFILSRSRHLFLLLLLTPTAPVAPSFFYNCTRLLDPCFRLRLLVRLLLMLLIHLRLLSFVFFLLFICILYLTYYKNVFQNFYCFYVCMYNGFCIVVVVIILIFCCFFLNIL